MKKVIISLCIGLALGLGINAATGTIVSWTGGGSRNNTVEFEILAPTVGTAADFVPGADNTNSLGTSSLKFDDVRTYDVNTTSLTATGTMSVTGVVTVTTITMTGALGLANSGAPNAEVLATRVGQLIFDTGSGDVCMSTSAAANSWVLLSTPTVSCP